MGIKEDVEAVLKNALVTKIKRHHTMAIYINSKKKLHNCRNHPDHKWRCNAWPHWIDLQCQSVCRQ